MFYLDNVTFWLNINNATLFKLRLYSQTSAYYNVKIFLICTYVVRILMKHSETSITSFYNLIKDYFRCIINFRLQKAFLQQILPFVGYTYKGQQDERWNVFKTGNYDIENRSLTKMSNIFLRSLNFLKIYNALDNYSFLICLGNKIAL